MAGIDNDVNFGLGYRLQATTSQQFPLMQQDATDVGFINNDGSPEGVVSANIGSYCSDRTNGVLYVKNTGSGNTGWSMLAFGGGTVSSVSGTSNRVTSTGGATPIIDIDAAYVGQSSITTLGTISLGTWNGSAIGPTYGGTGLFTYSAGDLIYGSASNTLSNLPASTDGKVLTLASGLPSWQTPASGTVTSVSGTANRITSTGGATPVIDIDAAFVGQSSITTLGTITTGVWNGTKVSEVYGGTNQSTYATGDVLYASGVNTLAKLPASTDGKVLTLASGIPSWATPTSGTVTSVSGTANRITSTGGSTPVIDIDAAYVGQGSITTLGTISTGTWSATNIALAKGGTGATIVASNGGIFYSNASTGALLAGTATANKMLMSGASSAPTWSTPTFPNASASSGKFIQSDGTNWVASTPTLPTSAGTSGKILQSDGTNYVESTPTYPSTSGSTGKILKSDGTNNVYSTATYPDTATSTGTILISNGTNWVASTPTYPNASVTAGKIIVSDGTNYVASTPTFPNASATSGKFITSDGTNWIASTPTLPTTAGTSGKILVSDGTNFVSSTPTYPNASATSRKIIVSDGTNFVASTETWAVPGSSGNLLSSDGTNWTATATPSVTSITLGGGTALSNYAEGTFTPTLVGQSTAGSTTYTAQQGYYTRIGNLVTIQGRMAITAATGTGAVNLTSFPFTIKNQTNGNANGTMLFGSATWTWPALTTTIQTSGNINTTTANVTTFGNGVNGTDLLMQNQAVTCRYTMSYQI